MAADGSISAPADPSRWRDAREWFQTRRPVLRDGASDTERDARLRAFRVAGITSVNLITEVHQAIDDALRDGTTLDEFKKRVGQKLAEEWGAPNARRVETIFRTNVQSAYNAGRFAEMTRPAVLAVRPFWKFVAILDGRTTATCAPLNGVIRPHDDPFWESHFPPLHFNCRSTVVSLSRGETERAGGAKKPPEAKPPSDGFGTRPDLAGEGLKTPSNAAAKVVESASARPPPPGDGGGGGGGDPPRPRTEMVPPEGHPSGPPPWLTGTKPAPPGEVVDPGGQFSAAELRVARLLAAQGNRVERVPESIANRERTPDALVNGVAVEFKSAQSGAVESMRKLVRSAWRKKNSVARQSFDVVLDVRGIGVTRESADQVVAAIRRRHPGNLRYLRIVGDAFDVSYSDFGTAAATEAANGDP